MKYEWKKQEKDLYGAKAVPALITVPAQNFIVIRGKGSPDDEAFSDRVAALYALAYADKMGYKSAARDAAAGGIDDFAVYPLEGVWSQKAAGGLAKESLEYALMIRQPDHIREDEVWAALERVKKKKPHPFYADIRFETMLDGPCTQMLHIGAYEDEPASFEAMARFAREKGLRLDAGRHREIYLSNPHRVEAGKLKTILRMSLQ